MSDTPKLKYLIVMPQFREDVEQFYQLPLGILYISAAMKKAGFDVTTLNLNHYASPYDLLRRTIEQGDIDVIMTGGLSSQFSNVRIIFETARDSKKEIVTICGGGLISADPQAAMAALEFVDYGVIGEGEETVIDLCKAIELKKDIAEVPGIVLKRGERFDTTEDRGSVKDLGALPWPDYQGFDYTQYLNLSSAEVLGLKDVSRAGTIITSRSCPFQCTFCFHTCGNTYRQRPLDDVFREIDYLISEYQVDFIYILDELFSLSLPRMKEFCERIKPYNIRWNTGLRVDAITPEVVALLKDANCDSVGLGIESADNSILKSMKKHITIEKIENALEILLREKMSFSGSLIFGDIEETVETSGNTINWWQNHQEYSIGMIMIKVYPGTHLYRHALEHKIIDDPIKFHRDGCPPVNVSKMSDDELAGVAKKIAQLQTEAVTMSNVKLLEIDYSKGKCSITGNCIYCNAENKWDNIMFFYRTFFHCNECKKRLAPQLPDELLENIDNNLEKIASDGNVLLWGLNDNSIAFLERSRIALADEKIFLTDLSTTKQKMQIGAKDVVPSNSLEENAIQTVVVLLPQYFSNINSYVDMHFKDKKVLSVYALFNPDFSLSEE